MSEKNPPKRGRGRPKKFVKKYKDRILEAIRLGATNIDACRYAGLSKEAYRVWKLKAEEGQADFVEFFERVEEAEAIGKIVHMRKITADKSWQSSAWWLERKFPDEWGKREPKEIKEALDKIEIKIDGIQRPPKEETPSDDNKTTSR